MLIYSWQYFTFRQAQELADRKSVQLDSLAVSTLRIKNNLNDKL